MKVPHIFSAMIFVAAPATAAQASTSPGEVQETLASAGKIFGVQPQARITASGEILLTNAAGVVEVGLSAVEQLLQGASGANRGILLRFVLAHEAWHARQLAEPGAAPVAAMSGADRRLRECAADTMAAYYVINVAGARLLADLAGLENIRRLVWNLPRSEDFHPVGHQRDTAVTLGFRLAMIELLQRRPQLNEEETLALAQMRKMSDWNATDSVPALAQRSCMQITQYDDGAGRLVQVTQANHKFHRKLEFPFVQYALSFRNSGSRAVQITFTPKVVLGVGVCKATRVPEDQFQPYLLFSNETRVFLIPPKESHHLVGMLPWLPTSDSCPRIDYNPRNARTMISYRFADGVPSAPTCLAKPGNPTNPTDAAFADGLRRIANYAESQFDTLRGKTAGTIGDKTAYDATVSLPGVTDLTIWVARNGTTEMRGDVYEGPNAATAAKEFRDLRNRLTRICPLTAGDWEESESDGESNLRINRFSDSSAIHVSMFRMDENRFVVTLKIKRMQDLSKN